METDCRQVRMRNLVREGNLSITRQPVVQVTVERCLAEVIQKADYRRIKEEVETFNRLGLHCSRDT